MPSTGMASGSMRSNRSRLFRIATAPGLIVSPHSLLRGNFARSSISTRAPPRASTVAAAEPAGPAPQTITSNIGYERAIPRMIALFFDPKPRQLHSAAAGDAARPWLGMKSMSHAGSVERWLIVAGRNPRESARAEVTIPAAPLAPCGWPIIDFVDEPGNASARAPNRRRTHRDSTASLRTVDVP